MSGLLLLTIPQAAAELGVSRWTMAAMVARGDIGHIPFKGGRKRVPRSELLSYVMERTVRGSLGAAELRRLG